MPLVSKNEVYKRKLKTLPVEKLRDFAGHFGIKTNASGQRIIEELAADQSHEDDLDRFIKQVYFEITSSRPQRNEIEVEVKKVDARNWGTVQGGLDQFIQRTFVRKYYRYDELLSAVSKELPQVTQGYTLSSWYNHWTTEVLEQIIAGQASVIPTIQKVKDTDIFWLGQPWDVKITNLPREWFDSGYSIQDAINNPVEAEKYLYMYQGAERFGDNNRLFIILYDTSNPGESWTLKRDFEFLEKEISIFFKKTNDYDKVEFVYPIDHKTYTALSKILFVVRK